MISKQQHSFVLRNRTTDVMLALRELMEKQKGVFVDAEKAYDELPRPKLYEEVRSGRDVCEGSAGDVWKTVEKRWMELSYRLTD